jgi:negative regulator of replication initiation
MTLTIRIDEEVYQILDKKAREIDNPFPTPNDVLRDILGLPPREKPSQTVEKAPPPRRRPSGRPATR